MSVFTTGCAASPQVDERPLLSLQVFMSHFTPGQACGEATQLQSYRVGGGGDLLTSPHGHCQVFIVNRGAKPQLTKKR